MKNFWILPPFWSKGLSRFSAKNGRLKLGWRSRRVRTKIILTEIFIKICIWRHFISKKKRAKIQTPRIKTFWIIFVACVPISSRRVPNRKSAPKFKLRQNLKSQIFILALLIYGQIIVVTVYLILKDAWLRGILGNNASDEDMAGLTHGGKRIQPWFFFKVQNDIMHK